MKATYIKTLDGWNGDARLYHLDPPLAESSWDGEAIQVHEYVIVSAVVAFDSGPETYIFPANPDGSAIDYLDLKGSFKGDLDHEQALRNAGYVLEGA